MVSQYLTKTKEANTKIGRTSQSHFTPVSWKAIKPSEKNCLSLALNLSFRNKICKAYDETTAKMGTALWKENEEQPHTLTSELNLDNANTQKVC